MTEENSAQERIEEIVSRMTTAEAHELALGRKLLPRLEQELGVYNAENLYLRQQLEAAQKGMEELREIIRRHAEEDALQAVEDGARDEPEAAGDVEPGEYGEALQAAHDELQADLVREHGEELVGSGAADGA